MHLHAFECAVVDAAVVVVVVVVAVVVVVVVVFVVAVVAVVAVSVAIGPKPFKEATVAMTRKRFFYA